MSENQQAMNASTLADYPADLVEQKWAKRNRKRKMEHRKKSRAQRPKFDDRDDWREEILK